MPICPEQYSELPPLELLEAASQGKAALDHRWLRALLERPQESVAAIARFVQEDRSRDRVDLEEELILLARHFRAPELLPYLLQLARRYSQDIPELLFETIASYGEQAFEPVLALYRELGPAKAGDVPFLLVSLGVENPEVDRVLKELATVDAEDAEFCRRVYEEIRRGERRAEPEPVNLWELFPEKDQPAFDELPFDERLEFFDCPSPETREAVAKSLFNLQDLPRRVIDKLIDVAQNDPDARVRAAAWRSLSLEAERRGILDKMLQRLEDPATPDVEKGGLLVALVDNVSDPKVRRFIIELYDKPEARAYALEAMWRSLDPRFAQFMVDHIDDPDPKIREQAILGAGYLGATAVLSRIERLLTDDQFRHPALVAYSLLAPVELKPEEVRKLLEAIDNKAGGLSTDEVELVKEALDSRMVLHRKKPVFSPE